MRNCILTRRVGFRELCSTFQNFSADPSAQRDTVYVSSGRDCLTERWTRPMTEEGSTLAQGVILLDG